MSKSVNITTPRVGGRALSFPDRCVCCSAPKEAESTLAVSRLVTVGKRQRQEQVKHSWRVPHCRRCAGSTKSVFLASLIPFCLGLVVFGVVAFGAVTAGGWIVGLDDYGQPNNANSLVLGACAGLLAGLLGGLLFELLARVVLLPWYGRGLLSAPLLAVQIFDDSDHVAGLAAKPNRDATQVRFVFDNAAVAGEFETLNAAAISR